TAAAACRPGLGEVDHQMQGPQRIVQEVCRLGGCVGVSRLEVIGCEASEPVGPRIALPGLQSERSRRLHSVAPRENGGMRVGSWAIELVVALPQQPEGVLVEPQPNVQAMLLDATVAAPAARTLAPKPPAALINSDPIEAVAPARFAEAPSRRHATHASP